MPIVPFNPQGQSQKSALPAPNDSWVLMAAATMDAEGRLVFDKPKEPPKVGDNANGT